MLGAIAGDMIGSPYERRQIKTTDFPLFQAASRFTDDTVLTVATAHALLERVDYAEAYRDFGRRYPRAGYGGAFIEWLRADDAGPYHSWGNGSAMRVSPVGQFFEHESDVLAESRRSAEVTHNHPEGIKGAQATALAVFRARTGASKLEIRTEISQQFGYDLSYHVDDIRPTYHFDVSCQGSVPQAIVAFLDSESFEEAVRLAVSLGGDSDTLACIAGGIAHAYYKEIPAEIEAEVRRRLPPDLLAVVSEFQALYGF